MNLRGVDWRFEIVEERSVINDFVIQGNLKRVVRANNEPIWKQGQMNAF